MYRIRLVFEKTFHSGPFVGMTVQESVRFTSMAEARTWKNQVARNRAINYTLRVVRVEEIGARVA